MTCQRLKVLVLVGTVQRINDMLERTVAKNRRLSKSMLRFSLKRRNQTYVIALQGTQLIPGVKHLQKN